MTNGYPPGCTQEDVDRAAGGYDPCPECGGSGFTEAQRERTVPLCCGRFRRDGSCCGNAVPGLEVDIVQEPCETCGRAVSREEGR
jgi:endogenous inhibitor of DNA gyrase (YacG/DUF329 family)